MVTHVQRRRDSRVGTSGSANPNRGQLVIPMIAHSVTYEKEMERGVDMTRAVCSCGKFASVRWSVPDRAVISGAAHVYAMASPRGPVIPRDTRGKGSERPVGGTEQRVYGKCYVHDSESPCGCLSGCVHCTGCYCSCDCVGG